MKRTLRVIILVSVITLILVLAGCSTDSEPSQGPQVGNQAPDFQLPSLDGQVVSLSQFLGKPVLINFWASWCGPCRDEVPFLQEVFEDKEWAEQGLVLLAINVGEKPDTIENFMESFALSFTVLLDTNLDIARMYRARSIPMTFFIDRNGIIKDVKFGSFANKKEIDRRLVNTILEE